MPLGRGQMHLHERDQQGRTAAAQFCVLGQDPLRKADPRGPGESSERQHCALFSGSRPCQCQADGAKAKLVDESTCGHQRARARVQLEYACVAVFVLVGFVTKHVVAVFGHVVGFVVASVISQGGQFG